MRANWCESEAPKSCPATQNESRSSWHANLSLTRGWLDKAARGLPSATRGWAGQVFVPGPGLSTAAREKSTVGKKLPKRDAPLSILHTSGRRSSTEGSTMARAYFRSFGDATASHRHQPAAGRTRRPTLRDLDCARAFLPARSLLPAHRSGGCPTHPNMGARSSNSTCKSNIMVQEPRRLIGGPDRTRNCSASSVGKCWRLLEV